MANFGPLLSGTPRHGLAFHSPLRVGGEWSLELFASARLVLAMGSPWRVNLCTFSLFFFFSWCLDIQFMYK